MNFNLNVYQPLLVYNDRMSVYSTTKTNSNNSLKVLVRSQNDEHIRFVSTLANALSVSYEAIDDLKAFFQASKTPEKTILFCDIQFMNELTGAGIDPNLLFIFSEQKLQEITIQEDMPFGHFLSKFSLSPEKSALELLPYLKTALNETAPALEHFLAEIHKTQVYEISHTGHKAKILEALAQQLAELGFNARVATTMITVVDELIMNAIFDAPVDASGARTMMELPRDVHFELPAGHHITFETSFDNDKFAISISDPFGSLDRKLLMKHLCKDYSADNYLVMKNTQGAGIGLSTSIQKGVSLHFYCEKGKNTKVLASFPRHIDTQSMRSSFQHISLIFR